jgi:hypothetical protein
MMMNIRKPYEALRFVLLGFVVVAGILSIIGSSPFGSGQSFGSNVTQENGAPEKGGNAAGSSHLGTTRSVEEVDKEIAGLRKTIDDLNEFKTRQRHIAIINSFQHEKSRGWIKGDGEPTYEDVADQANAQVVGTEQEIEQLTRKLANAESEKKAILSQSMGCFPPDTLVKMEDGRYKPFNQIHPGDRVLTYDIGYEKQQGKQVLEVYSVAANHLYTINGEFVTTGGERLLSGDGWKEVRNLKIGDTVHVNGRMREVVSIEYSRVNNTLHNMQVNDAHNFYVMTANGSQYLVHNSSGGGGK